MNSHETKSVSNLAPIALVLLAACGGSGGSGSESSAGSDPGDASTDSFPGCLSQSWNLSVTEVGAPSCVDLGLDGANVSLDGAQGSDIPNDNVLGYFVHTDDVDVVIPGAVNTMLRAFYVEFSLVDLVQYVGFAGYYYLPEEDVTVFLSEVPSQEELAQVFVDCESFLTFVEFQVYQGRPLIFTPAPFNLFDVELASDAQQLCAGRLRIHATKAAVGTAASTSEDGEDLLIGVLRPSGSASPILLRGVENPEHGCGVLCHDDGLVIELSHDAEGRVRANQGGGANDGGAGSPLEKVRGGLGGDVQLETEAGVAFSAHLLVKRVASLGPDFPQSSDAFQSDSL